MPVARCSAALGLLVVLGSGCSTTSDQVGTCFCNSFPGEDAVVTIEFGCAAQPTGMTLSGPGCSDAQADMPLQGDGNVQFSGSAVGVCHVSVTFANGGTYAAEVEFSDPPEAPCNCPSLVASTPMLTATCSADAGHE